MKQKNKLYLMGLISNKSVSNKKSTLKRVSQKELWAEVQRSATKWHPQIVEHFQINLYQYKIAWTRDVPSSSTYCENLDIAVHKRHKSINQHWTLCRPSGGAAIKIGVILHQVKTFGAS